MSSDLPDDWRLQPLETICERVSVGHVGETSSFFTEFEGVPFIRSQNVRPNRVDLSDIKFITNEFHAKTKKSQLRAGDLLIVRVGQNRGDCAVMPAGLSEVNCANIVFARPDPKYSNFLGAYFNTPQGHDALLSVSSGSAQLVLNTKAIAKIEVPVPPPSAAEAIGNLSRIFDDRISLLRETNSTLQAIAQALFRSWFVDFDPVRAKTEGRTPEGLDEATAALFPDSFEETVLGPMPMGWRMVTFGELLTHTIGGDWGTDAPHGSNDTRVAIIRGTDIPDLQTGAENRVPIRYTSAKKLAPRKLMEGDILLEVSGGSKDQPTGRALYLTDALLSQFDSPVEPASFCRLLRPSTKAVGVLLSQHLTYIYAQGKTWEYQNQSTGIANFQTTRFLSTEPVVVPSQDILNAFASTVGSLIDRTHLTQIRELSTLRDILLPRLISGQLQLPEVQNAN